MEPVLGPGRCLARATVLLAMGFWCCGLVYILLPSHLWNFQQQACEHDNHVVNDFYFIPILIFRAFPLWAEILSLAPFVLVGIAWVVALLRKRKQIFPKEGSIYWFSSLKAAR